MHNSASIFELRGIRQSDTNSLLRMHDLAREISAGSPLQQERARADKAIQRIVTELRKRNVTVGAVMTAAAEAPRLTENLESSTARRFVSLPHTPPRGME